MKIFPIKRPISVIVVLTALVICMIIPMRLNAQIADGQDRFLGNIYYKGQLPLNFDLYWNQITPENAGKWASCEQAIDDFNYWLWLDRAYEHAQTMGYVFKEHTFVWGHSSGEPAWVCALPAAEQRVQVEEWIAAYAQRYPDTDLIDVVNEPLHDPPCYKDAIGGDGDTGWDWVIWSYEKARQYMPNAKLLINDYNILNSAQGTTNYIALINLLKERGLLDGIGCEAHSLESVSYNLLKSNLDALAATGLPLYITEYDVNVADDTQQRTVYQEQFPLFWEHWAVAGVTLWGYVEGEIWRTDAYLVHSDGTERPAMQWLKSYMAENPTQNPSPAPTQAPSALFLESGGQVSMEAEQYTNYYPGTGEFANHAWVEETTMTDASGGAYMHALPNENMYALSDPTAPFMGYFVDFSTSGNYYLWVRRAAQGGGDDSCQIAVDGGGPIEWSWGGGSTFDWVKYSSALNFSGGAHVLRIGMREDGALVDKIVLTTSSSYTPSGTGPAESIITGDIPTNAPTQIPTTAPTSDPTIAPTLAPTQATLTRGDANGNGTIDIVDALLVAQYYVGLPVTIDLNASDTNCDGSADIVDALLIAQYYVGLISQFC